MEEEDIAPANKALFAFYDLKDVTLEEIEAHGTKLDLPGVFNLASRRKLFISPHTPAWDVYQLLHHVDETYNTLRGLWLERDYYHAFKNEYHQYIEMKIGFV